MKHVCCIDCPRGFHYIASVNGCYYVHTRRLTWDQATGICRALHRNAHLIIINNGVEQMAVRPWLKSVSCQYRFFVIYRMHLQHCKIQLLSYDVICLSAYRLSREARVYCDKTAEGTVRITKFPLN